MLLINTGTQHFISCVVLTRTPEYNLPIQGHFLVAKVDKFARKSIVFRHYFGSSCGSCRPVLAVKGSNVRFDVDPSSLGTIPHIVGHFLQRRISFVFVRNRACWGLLYDFFFRNDTTRSSQEKKNKQEQWTSCRSPGRHCHGHIFFLQKSGQKESQLTNCIWKVVAPAVS